jgi:hypothetical protein
MTKSSAMWGTIAFGVTLAVIIGVRLEQAALAVVVGVASGIAASLPAGLFVFYLMRRRNAAPASRPTTYYGREMAGGPPVLVIQPPATPALPQPATWPAGYSMPVPAQREFAVIGEEGLEDGIDYWQA